MNRANQQALFQATNQGLLGIRQQEINYYLNLNLAFGTQAALIGGFTYGVFTQNQVNPDNSYGDVMFDICWIVSAATIATAVHVILNTMMLQVYGPGLALHGPVGSIVRATEGMKTEQKQIVTSFILMMSLFAISTTLSFWVVMNFYSAIGSTAVFLIAARYWYYYTERIYLRFYWDQEKDAFVDREPGERESEYMPPTMQGDSLRINADARSDSGYIGSSLGGAISNSRKKTRMQKFFSRFKAAQRSASVESGKQGPHAAAAVAAVKDAGIMDKAAFVQSKSKLMAMEGYLTKSGMTPPENKKEPWERRYFTLTKVGLLFFYRSRIDFRSAPKAPINQRPLNIKDYLITLSNTDEATRQASVSAYGGDGATIIGDGEEDPPLMHRTSLNFFTTATPSVAETTGRSKSVNSTRTPLLSGAASVSGSSTKHVFEMVLVLRDAEEAKHSKRWILRCDTEEELDVWVSCMRDISPDSFDV